MEPLSPEVAAYQTAVSKVVDAALEFMLYADLGPEYRTYNTRLSALRRAVFEFEELTKTS